MGYPQRLRGIGVAMAATASTDIATPKLFLPAASAKITEVPKIYKRDANYARASDYAFAAGFDYAFSASGVTGNCELLGYLFWLWAGGDSFAATRHTLTPNDTGQYLNFFVDEGLPTATPLNHLIGARIAKITMSQAETDLFKWAIEGVACDRGVLLAAVAPSLPSGEDNAPLAWAHFQDAGGFFKVGVGGAVPASDPTVKGWEISCSQGVFPQGKSLGSNQPTDQHVGQIEVGFKFKKELFGADAAAQITALRAQNKVGIDMKAIVGANDFQLTIPNADFNADAGKEVGAKDDVVMVEFSADAQKDGATPIITVVTKDGTIGVYT
jgi:hypothetical protein